MVNANETITALFASTTGGVPYMRRFTSSGGVDSTFSFGVTGLSGTPQDMDRTADASKFYKPHARADARSLMNITFRLPSDELTDKFVKEAQAAGLDGLKGHRNVGGIRASTYNAMPKAGCEALAAFMREFERKNG